MNPSDAWQPKRQQDLIYLKCPRCSSRLEDFDGHVKAYWCKTENCGFTIFRRKLAQILLDEKFSFAGSQSDSL